VRGMIPQLAATNYPSAMGRSQPLQSDGSLLTWDTTDPMGREGRSTAGCDTLPSYRRARSKPMGSAVPQDGFVLRGHSGQHTFHAVAGSAPRGEASIDREPVGESLLRLCRPFGFNGLKLLQFPPRSPASFLPLSAYVSVV